MSSLVFWDALRPLLPQELATQLGEGHNVTHSTLDSLVRFLAGADPSSHLISTSPQTWKDCQTRSKHALDQLVQSNGNLKRPRDDHAEENASSKRPRQDEDDTALYTLHAVSTTSPIRKKVDISITRHSITFKNPTSGALESTVPLDSLKRAFVIPTQGKSKPHWTVVLLTSDTPGGKDSAGQQVIFGLDATATAPFTTTTSGSTATKHPKGTETYSLIYAFLDHLPSTVSVLEPEPAVFCSAATKGVAGIGAYRAAKAGTLWFFRQGILWGESKPCEFWAVEDLIGKSEGLRTLSATGRTCSVYLTRKGEERGEGEGEEDLGDETEFSMVDGKEQDPIHQWVRQHRHLFGRPKGAKDDPASAVPDTTPVAVPTIKGGKTTFNQLVLDEHDDEDDEDFAASSDDDSGADSAASSSGSDDEDADGSDEAEESGEDEDADGDAEMDLDPAHHPLMQPGAMRKMSKAAIDMVVGMVEEELVGGGGDSDEEDQLEE